ncbi:hypothetical protein D3C85_1251980 [compost metagenome]
MPRNALHFLLHLHGPRESGIFCFKLLGLGVDLFLGLLQVTGLLGGMIDGANQSCRQLIDIRGQAADFSVLLPDGGAQSRATLSIHAVQAIR